MTWLPGDLPGKLIHSKAKDEHKRAQISSHRLAKSSARCFDGRALLFDREPSRDQRFGPGSPVHREIPSQLQRTNPVRRERWLSPRTELRDGSSIRRFRTFSSRNSFSQRLSALVFQISGLKDQDEFFQNLQPTLKEITQGATGQRCSHQSRHKSSRRR
jgi:hypothetical protein